jgi:hypothetical protein
MNFGMKNFTVWNDYKINKTLVFECYNLVNSMELGVVTFKIDVQQSNFRSYGYFPHFIQLVFWGKIIPSTMSKIA